MADPSDNLEYPNRRLEDQDVEMKPVVLGPGAYGSPDEATQANRLLPLNEHPQLDAISEDYGQDVQSATAPADEKSDDYSEWTVDELKTEAADRELEGRSQLTTKDDLVKALKKDDKAADSDKGN